MFQTSKRGYENIYTLSWQGSFEVGKALIFGNRARDNLVYAMNLPVDGVVNNASRSTNLIVPLKPVGFNIITPAVPPSNINVENRQSYSVWVTILMPGEVKSWTITDSNGNDDMVSSVLLAGQTFLLEPGEKIKFDYTTPPTWKWKALR